VWRKQCIVVHHGRWMLNGIFFKNRSISSSSGRKQRDVIRSSVREWENDCLDPSTDTDVVGSANLILSRSRDRNSERSVARRMTCSLPVRFIFLVTSQLSDPRSPFRLIVGTGDSGYRSRSIYRHTITSTYDVFRVKSTELRRNVAIQLTT